MDALPISFEVPERLVEGDCRPEELGNGTGEEVETTRDSAMRGNRVAFSLFDMDRDSRLVRTDVLDKLFAPVLPAVQVNLMDFI